MTRAGRLNLGILGFAAGCVYIGFYVIIADDLAWWGAFLALLGALLYGGLGTYTDLDVRQRPREKPGAIRELLLGDGKRKVKKIRWQIYLAIRLCASATLIGGFAIALFASIEAQQESNKHFKEIVRLGWETHCLKEAHTKPGADNREAIIECLESSSVLLAE